MAVSAGKVTIPMRLLIQVNDREPSVIATGGYEARLDGDGVFISPNAIRDAIRSMLAEASEKAAK